MNLAASTSLALGEHVNARFNTVCVDFDGTIAEHTPTFMPHDAGRPKENGIQFLLALRHSGFRIVILTARTELGPVKTFLERHGLSGVLVTNVKPPAIAYVDDRGLNWTEKEQIPLILKKIEKLRNLYLQEESHEEHK
jgi:hypothetical protein